MVSLVRAYVRAGKQAEAHAADDLKKAETVKIRNEADGLAYSTEQQLKEHGEKVPEEDRAKIESSINNLREALKGDDGDAIKKAQETLVTDAQAIGKSLYEEAAKQAAADGDAPVEGEAPAAEATDDNVIDAEFEVKDAK